MATKAEMGVMHRMELLEMKVQGRGMIAQQLLEAEVRGMEFVLNLQREGRLEFETTRGQDHRLEIAELTKRRKDIDDEFLTAVNGLEAEFLLNDMRNKGISIDMSKLEGVKTGRMTAAPNHSIQSRVSTTQAYLGQLEKALNQVVGTYAHGSVKEFACVVTKLLNHLAMGDGAEVRSMFDTFPENGVLHDYSMKDAELTTSWMTQGIANREVALTTSPVLSRVEADLAASMSRKEVIEKAKNIVAVYPDTSRYVTLGKGEYGLAPTRRYSRVTDAVKYSVDYENRTIEAQLVDKNTGEVWKTAKSVCIPDDVFNIHIGKAIALMKVLGMTPYGFLVKSNLPTYNDIEVGDIVRDTAYNIKGKVQALIGNEVHIKKLDLKTRNKWWNHSNKFVILDDSKEGL